MTQPDKKVAIEHLQNALNLLPVLMQLERDDARFKKWRRDTRIAIEFVFGAHSSEVKEFGQISFMPIVLTPAALRDAYLGGLSTAEATLQSMIQQARTYWPEDAQHMQVTQGDLQATSPKDVFIVHGRDDGTRETVARFVERLGLKPVILAEQASEGRTIIEKFEAHAEVGYAVVLLTADDVGALKGENLQPRARQNVIFELGFFSGKLGRKRVCALTRGKPEIPSDYAGVVYIAMDSGESWKMRLIGELKAARLEVDANGAFD